MNEIDLRSDTFTMPTMEMRQVIAEAEVGDDVFGEDPTVIRLQVKIAELLGKESALFVPSGTMANQISIAVQTHPGDEVIVESDAHIFYYEAAAPAIISRVQLRPIPSSKGMMPVQSIESAIRGNDVHFPPTKLLCLENTHNRHGGTVIDIDYIKEVRTLAQKNKISMHCDGARLWNASAATGITPADYAGYFDTVSVCLSKGLGAPVGSVIASTRENILSALRWRKILGGGMRQVGIIAAAGLFVIENNLQNLKNDHANAKLFAEKLLSSEFIEIDINTIETNIVIFKLKGNANALQFEKKCLNNGLKILAIGPNTIRAVFHYQITRQQTEEAAEIIKNLVKI
ncbi:MAG: L-threonine aldolase [Ignavibacteria bacterium]|nr:L-threonine aldolase [Ignavibacteria bacterium]